MSINLDNKFDKMFISNVKFENKSESFKKLIEEAKLKAQDGTISDDDIAKLEAYASKTGETLTLDEKIFITALKNKDNVEKLKSAEFNPSSFSMEAPTRFVGISGYKRDTYADFNNPVGGKIRDIGKDRFNVIMNDSKITFDTLKGEILKLPSLSDPKLKEQIEKFISKLPSGDKEAMMYVKELLTNRTPSLNTTDLKNIFTQLNKMMTIDYDSRIGNRRDLIVSALHDIAAPSNISQMDIGTCGGTTIQIQLAIKNPSKYLDMLSTLAQNKIYTANNQGFSLPIKPNWTFTDEKVMGLESNRTISSKIMQNAIMDDADGFWQRYNSASLLGDVRGGLTDSEITTGLSSIFGKPYQNYSTADFTPHQLMQILKNNNPSNSNPISITMAYDSKGRDAFHVVNVIGLDSRKNTVTIINPWGREETFSLDKMEGKILSIQGEPNKLAGVDRISDFQLQTKIDSTPSDWYESTDSAAKLIVDSSRDERRELLNSLDISQKAKLLTSLSSGSVTDTDKVAMLRILEYILQGNEGQDKKLMYDLTLSLKSQGGSLRDVLSNAQEDSPLFFDVAKEIYTVNKDNQIALNILDDMDLGKKFLKHLEKADLKEFAKTNPNFLKDDNFGGIILSRLSNKELAEVAKNANGDSMADEPKVAAKLLTAMIKTYNAETDKHVTDKNRTVSLDDIRNFVNEIDNDATEDDDTMKIVLGQIITINSNGNIDITSDYGKLQKSASDIINKIWNIAN